MVKIADKKGKSLGQSEALLDTGADITIADQRFLRSIGMKKKDLDKPNNNKIRGATQHYFNQLGKVKLRLNMETIGLKTK